MTIKIKVAPRTTIKAKAATRIVGQITAGEGIDVVKSGGNYTISVDLDGSSIVTGPAVSTDNAVPRFDGTDGTVLQNSNVTISDTNVMTVNANAAALPAPLTGTVLHVGGADNTVTRVGIDSFGGGTVPNVTFRMARGTGETPSAATLGDTLGSVTWNAYGASAYASSGRAIIQALAEENWTDAAQGAKLEFRMTPAGAVTAAAVVATIGSGGTFTLTPTAASTNQGLVITQSTPTSGSVQGEFNFNEINVTSGVTILDGSPSTQAPFHDWVASGLKTTFNVGANAKGFQIGQLIRLNHLATTEIWQPAGINADFIGVAIQAYTNAADTSSASVGAGFFGLNTATLAGASAVHGDFISLNPESIMLTGATITTRVGMRVQSGGDAGVQGSTLDAAITITGNTNIWNDGIVFGDVGALKTAVSQNLMKSHIVFTTVNGFDFSNVTVTGSIAKWGTVVDWKGTGHLALTIDHTTHNGLVIQNTNTGGVCGITMENDLGASDLLDMGVRGSLRASFGALVANDAYIFSNHANGLLLVNSGSGPIRFATGSGSGNTEKARITPSGGLNVGATTDITVGVISALTGFRIGNAAAGGRVLKGNNTTFVSAQPDLGQCGFVVNGTVVESHAGNVATYAVKTLAGADPSAADPVRFYFRSSTASSGSYTVIEVTAALSIAISSTATLGHQSGIAQQIILYAINNAGAVELAVSTKFFDQSTRLVSTTLMAAAVASPSTMYSTTARSNVPFIPIARAVSNQATAGTWVTSPTQIDLAPFTLPTNAINVDRNGTDQTGVVTVTFTKLALTNDSANGAYDVDGVFDAATNYRYQPNVAGKYLVSYTGTYSAGVDQTLELLVIYKNGVDTIRGLTATISGALGAGGAAVAIVDMNGTTDYLEFYVWHNTGADRTIVGTAKHTFVQAQRIGV